MYVPAQFRVDDPAMIRDFILDNSFATLVSSSGATPVATHLPFLVDKKEESLELSGHLSRANPQWKSLEDGKEVLAIFQGPHAYISSRWYSAPGVPTWNYQAVHCYGSAMIVTESDELKRLLSGLVAQYEEVAALPEVDSMLQGIVGFRIRVTRIEASFKLSQNKESEERKRLIDGLRGRPDEFSHQVAEAMERRFEDKSLR